MTTLNRYQDAQCQGAMARARRDCTVLRSAPEGVTDAFEPAWLEAFVIGWVFGT